MADIETVVLNKKDWETTLDMLNKITNLSKAQEEFIKTLSTKIAYLEELVVELEKPIKHP